MKKRILSMFIAIVMVVGLIPATALTAFAEAGDVASVIYPLWVGGEQINSANASDVFGDGKVSYDANTNTLTLNNYTYQGTGYACILQKYAAIYYSGGETLKFVLKGDSTVTHQTTSDMTGSFGIYSESGITVSADSTGSLTATGGEITAASDAGIVESYGVYVIDGDLTVSGGSLTVIGGNVTAASGESLGVYVSGTLTVSAGSLTAVGGSADTSYGICFTYGATISGGEIVAKGKTQSFLAVPTIEGAAVYYDENGNMIVDNENPHQLNYLRIKVVPTVSLNMMLQVVDSTGAIINGDLITSFNNYSLDSTSITFWSDIALGDHSVTFSGENVTVPDGYLPPANIALTVTDIDGDGWGEISTTSSHARITKAVIGENSVYIIIVTLTACPSHADTDSDGLCDDCSSCLAHTDTDSNGWCDNCSGCFEHPDTDNDGWCDNCNICIQHLYGHYSGIKEGHYPLCSICGDVDYSDFEEHTLSSDGYYCTNCIYSFCKLTVTNSADESISDSDQVNIGDELTATLLDPNNNIISGATYRWYIRTIDAARELSTNATCTVTAADRTLAEGGYLHLMVYHPTATNDSGEKLCLGNFHFAYPPAATITGASITVGSDLTMKYYVTTADDLALSAGQSLAMQFTMNAKTTLVTDYITVDGEYVFAFENIAPQQMADLIDAEVVLLDADGAVVNTLASKYGYSVRDNAMALLEEDSTDQALAQFVVDLLYYGTAAQKYQDYGTDVPANDWLPPEISASTALPTESETVKKLVTAEGVTIGNVYFTSATVWFDNVNKIGVKLSTTENVKLVVKVGDDTVGTTYENLTSTTFYTDAIYATGFDTVYTFELYEGDTLVQTLTYSVNSYVYAMMGKTEADGTTPTEMAELAKALYRYGASAKGYLEAQQTTFVETADDLLTALNQSGSVKLNADIDLSTLSTSNDGWLYLSASGIEVVLDLNGYTIKGTHGCLSIKSGVVLTVKDSSEAKTGKIIAPNHSGIYVSNGATLNLIEGTVQGESGDIHAESDSTVTISESYTVTQTDSNGAVIYSIGNNE